MSQNTHIDWLTSLGLYETRYIIYDTVCPELFDELGGLFKLMNEDVRNEYRCYRWSFKDFA